jgi:hypothetical protein
LQGQAMMPSEEACENPHDILIPESLWSPYKINTKNINSLNKFNSKHNEPELKTKYLFKHILPQMRQLLNGVKGQREWIGNKKFINLSKYAKIHAKG